MKQPFFIFLFSLHATFLYAADPQADLRTMLAQTGMNHTEIEQIITENERAQKQIQQQKLSETRPSIAHQTLPDPKKDREAFKAEMIRRAQNKKFGNLGK
ncbi:MAG: hypothetical protein WD055_03665 [Candidatus Dependentiae bacterium]